MVKKKIIGMMMMALLSLPGVVSQLYEGHENIEMSCRENDEDAKILIQYNPVVEIGTEWHIYLDWNGCNNLTFRVVMSETAMGSESRGIALTNDSEKDGIVFQRYTFYEEDFNVLVTFSLLDEDGNIKESKEIYIDVNKTIPNDLRNLWIAMSLFWVGIGGYMIYMYQKNIKIKKDLKALKEEKDEEKN